MYDQTEIHEIIANYLNNTISDKERIQLQNWINQSDDNKRLFEQLTQPQYLAEELQKLYTYDEDKGWKQVNQHLAGYDQEIPLKKRTWKVWLAAASVTGLLVVAYYLFFNDRHKLEDEHKAMIVKAQDVAAPSSPKATIQLANGQVVSLDSITSGLLAGQGNVNVIKNNDGQIIYQGTATATLYNTLVNPRGGTVVSLVLHDGTKVWLNSESSLRYPMAFTSNERKVEITGEAYFEVAKNSGRQFIVSGNGVQTVVLGTHFNINTYNDEDDIRVTLVEGSVKVVNDQPSLKGQSVILKPGEQAAVRRPKSVEGSTTSQPIPVHTVDTDKIISWTTGVFSFEDEDLPTIMRQLARWYDVEVSFSGAISQQRYSGIFSRQLNLSKVLTVIKMAGVKYSIEGKKLTIETTE